MGSFGERLQREREMRGITLEEIAEATKIGTRSLRALEEEEFDKLPGGIFNKGFVRAYSRFLGIDEEQAVADYISAVGEAQSSGRATRPEAETSAAPAKNLGNIEDDDQPRVPQIAWAALALVAIVVAAGFAGARYVSQHGWPQLRRAQAASVPVRPAAAPPIALLKPSTAAAATTSSPSTPAAVPVSGQPVTADAPVPAPKANAAPDGFLLRIRAKKDAWVQVTVDGKQEMQGTLAADAEKAVRAQREVVFKTGDAGAIELFHNNKLLPSLGGEKQVKQVTITAQGLQETKSKKSE